MDTSVKSLNKWANAHTNFWFDFMRIALGIFLIYKGYSFITNTAEFDGIIAPTKLYTGGRYLFIISPQHI